MHLHQAIRYLIFYKIYTLREEIIVELKIFSSAISSNRWQFAIFSSAIVENVSNSQSFIPQFPEKRAQILGHILGHKLSRLLEVVSIVHFKLMNMSGLPRNK